jgi:hypothetical protein
MWTWKQLTGSTSLDRVVIAELWAGFILYLSRSYGNAALPMMAVGFATIAWAILIKGFYWRDSDTDPAPLLAGRLILAAIGSGWLACSVYLLRLSAEP